jgi:hypothetical protein
MRDLAAGVVTGKPRVALPAVSDNRSGGVFSGGRLQFESGDAEQVRCSVRGALEEVQRAMYAARQAAVVRCVQRGVASRADIVDAVAAHRAAGDAGAAASTSRSAAAPTAGPGRHAWEWPVFVVPWSEGGDGGAAAEAGLKAATGGYTVRCYASAAELTAHGVQLPGGGDLASGRCAWTGAPAQQWAVLAKSF